MEYNALSDSINDELSRLNIDLATWSQWLDEQKILHKYYKRLFEIEHGSSRTWRWINVDVFLEKCLQVMSLKDVDFRNDLEPFDRSDHWGEVLLAGDADDFSSTSMISIGTLERDDSSDEVRLDAQQKSMISSHELLHVQAEENRVWIDGRAVLLCTQVSMAKVLAAKGFKEGVEFVIDRTIHTVLLGFLLYQLYFSKNLFDAVEIYRNADSVSIRNMIHLVAKTRLKSIAWILPFAPLVWGVAKGVYMSRLSKESPIPSFRESARYAEQFGSEERCSSCLESAIWIDALRWVLPLHPLDSHINYLKYLILWDGRLSIEERERAFNALMTLADRPYYTSIAVIHLIAKIAQGHAFSQMTHLDDATVEALLKIKVRAFDRVLRDAERYGGVYGIYCSYLKWALGACSSTWLSVGFLGYKLGKLALKVLFFRAIVKGVIHYLDCPDMPGFSYHGYAPWASDYTFECFNAYIALFNQIPGQSSTQLLEKIPDFHLPAQISLDLSGKSLTGVDILQFIQALEARGVSVVHLNISGNSVNTPDDINYLFPALSKVKTLDWSLNELTLSPEPSWPVAFVNCSGYLSSLEVLHMRGNSYLTEAFMSSYQLEVFSIGLQKLSALKEFYLVEQGVGSGIAEGTVALGRALAYLKNLRVLDLSNNQIGSSASSGVEAIGYSLGNLTQLEIFDFSTNMAVLTDSKGFHALLASLRFLSKLRILNLGFNNFGMLTSSNLVQLSEALSGMPLLQKLDLTENGLGSIDSNGVFALGENLHYLKALEFLGLSHNYLGTLDSMGVANIFEKMKVCTALSEVMLVQNRIDSTDQVASTALLQSIPSMHNLEILALDDSYISYARREEIRDALFNYTKVKKVYFMQLSDEPDINAYFARFPQNTTQFDLSDKLQFRDYGSYIILVENLLRFPNLTDLSLSNNDIGENSSNSTKMLALRLGELTTLERLDLSFNNIGFIDDSAVVSLSNSLSQLVNLKYLNMSGNVLGINGCDGVSALGVALGNFMQLHKLDLSLNQIGTMGTNGTASLAKGIAKSSSLRYLNFQGNTVGSSGGAGVLRLFKALGQHKHLTDFIFSFNPVGTHGESPFLALAHSLGNFTSLRKLDLRATKLGYVSDHGARAIASTLWVVNQTTYLDLAINYYGYFGFEATRSLGESLGNLTKLVHLDLGDNYIGASGANGTVSVAHGMRDLEDLGYVDLSQNEIATVSQVGFKALLKSLLSLQKLDWVNLKANSHVETTWQALSPLQLHADNSYLERACHSALCYSQTIPVVQAPISFFISSDMVKVNDSVSLSQSVLSRESLTTHSPLRDSMPAQNNVHSVLSGGQGCQSQLSSYSHLTILFDCLKQGAFGLVVVALLVLMGVCIKRLVTMDRTSEHVEGVSDSNNENRCLN